jgi:hypothetical protein
MPSTDPTLRSHTERGTASMEALLCLPFVLLIFALSLNVGYGWLVRLKAEAGARYAVERYLVLTERPGNESKAQQRVREEVQHLYFPNGGAITLAIGTSGSDLEGSMRREHATSGVLTILRRFAHKLSGRTEAVLTAPRRVPTRTLLPDTPVRVFYAMDGKTWTHEEIPLTLDAMTDAGKENTLPAGLNVLVGAISWAGEKFFQLLGMEP